MTDQIGDPPIHKFFTESEIAEIEAFDDDPTTQEGETTMPRTPLPADATRAQKLAALPPLAGTAGNPAYERVLDRLADTAITKLGEVDDQLTDLADEFAIRFREDDERAAVRDRISNTASAHRNKPRG